MFHRSVLSARETFAIAMITISIIGGVGSGYI